MGRRSSARLTFTGCLALAALFAAAGCQEREARTPRQAIEPGPGYAYTAVLMSAHPLYDALARLELATRELGREDELGIAAGLMGPPLGAVTLIETLAYGPNLDRLLQRREWWAEQYRRHHGLAAEMPRDLWAGLEWESDDARRQVEQRMRQAEAEMTRRMARLRARLVREQQERLNNLELGLSGRESDVLRAAELERDRIWRSIDRRLELGREAGDVELAELRAELEAEAQARVVQAREQAEETARLRREQMGEAGQVLHDEMAGEIEAEACEALPPQSMTADPSEANSRLAEGEASWADAREARDEVLRRQRHLLLAAQARLGSRLKEETELWAMTVARRHDVQLQLVPGGSRVGRDMTGSIAAELERVWSSGLE